MAMNIGGPNRSFPSQAGSVQSGQPSQVGSAQSGQSSQSIQPTQCTDLESHVHIGSGFQVKNGRIFVDNPANNPKELARNIHNGMEYHSKFIRKPRCKLPSFDENTQS